MMFLNIFKYQGALRPGRTKKNQDFHEMIPLFWTHAQIYPNNPWLLRNYRVCLSEFRVNQKLLILLMSMLFKIFPSMSGLPELNASSPVSFILYLTALLCPMWGEKGIMKAVGVMVLKYHGSNWSIVTLYAEETHGEKREYKINLGRYSGI